MNSALNPMLTGVARAGRKKPGSWSYRGGVLSRILAAALGGYALASAWAALLAAALPMTRADAVVVGTLSSFLVCALAVMWVFAARTAARAWIGLLAPAAAMLALLFPPF